MNFNWKQLIEINNEEVVGLDIGSFSVKMIQLQKNDGGFSIVAAGKADIDCPPSEEDVEGHDKAAVRAINECFKTANSGAQLAICSLCGPEVAVRPFKFPSLPPEEMQGAIMLEAAQVCPFNFSDSVVDHQLLSTGSEGMKGVLVAATDRLIRKKQSLAEQAGLKTALVDVDGLALLNCLKEWSNVGQGKIAAALNVGSSYTTLAIIGADNLPFIRDIAYAGRTIIEKLAASIAVEPLELQKMFASGQIAQDLRPKIAENLSIACQRLIDDISETLRYYAANEKTFVEEIYLCGGFSIVEGFADLLKTRFTAEVKLWNPFENISERIAPHCRDFLKKEGPAMAVAAGLAIRQL